MINFILVEDNKYFLNFYEDMLVKIMFKKNFKFNIYKFEEYTNDFFELVNSKKENKIYLLDIVTKNNNGIKVGELIRNKDEDSKIIFMSAYEDEYATKLIRSSVEFYSFISKSEEIENVLNIKINEILNKIEKKALIFENKNGIYTLPINNVIRIEKEKNSRNVKVITDTYDFYCNKSLLSLEEEIDSFIRVHRNLLINPHRTLGYDFKKGKIYFDNKTMSDYISLKYKNNLKDKIKEDCF